jgi:WD40 repeat protein
MIAIYNARRHRQTRFFSNTTNRAFSCILFSHDGRYLLAGEIGMGARVLVFDFNSEQIRPCAVLNCSVAKIGGISCVSISRCCKYIAACLDTSLCVWSFAPSETPLSMVADAKVSEKITSISFAPSSVSGTPGAACVFVTTGNKSLRFWSFDPVGTKVRSTAGCPAASPLSCTLAQLGDFANDAFVDCVFDTAVTGSTEGNVYALTASGKLVCVDSRHVVEKWVDLRMPNATALSLSGTFISIQNDVLIVNTIYLVSGIIV